VRSLRGRLTLGIVAALAIVLAIAGAVASHEVSSSSRSAFDDRLRRTAELSRVTARASVQKEIPQDDQRLNDVLAATDSSLRLVIGKTVLLDTGAPLPTRTRLPTGLHTFTAGGVDFRSYVTTLRDPNLGGLARLEIVSSLAGLERRQSALNRRLAALGLIALAIAGLGAWLAADLVLRPLTRLREVASRIAADEDLDRRVPDSGPGELRSLAASFNAMLARLGRSARDREQALAATRRFAADAGHELRTPLTSVQATLSTLGRHPDLSAERRSAMIADALSEQQRLVALLDGLQALARGDAQPFEHEEVDLTDVVDGVVTAAAAAHPRTALRTELPETAVTVSGWEPGLRLLVDNLVKNAVRHGRDGGRVEVTLTTAGLLQVDDDGPGVAIGDRERIFEPFVHDEQADDPGSGLGLALAAQQARHHGTAIEVGDAPLGGARFSVRFAPAPGAGAASGRP